MQIDLPLFFLLIDPASMKIRCLSRSAQTRQPQRPIPTAKPTVQIGAADDLAGIGRMADFFGTAAQIVNQFFIGILSMNDLKLPLLLCQRFLCSFSQDVLKRIPTCSCIAHGLLPENKNSPTSAPAHCLNARWTSVLPSVRPHSRYKK